MPEVKKTLGVIPAPSTAITTEPVLEHAHGSLTIRFEYDRDEKIYRSGVEIQRVRAYRYRAESHCTAWHIEAYDTLIEVEGSAWVAELAAAEPAETGGFFEMHHYMLYLDSAGCYEIVGATWSLLPEARVG